jgi:hypothetical protein
LNTIKQSASIRREYRSFTHRHGHSPRHEYLLESSAPSQSQTASRCRSTA